MSHTSSQGSGIIAEEGKERVYKPEAVSDYTETVSSGPAGQLHIWT